MNTTVTEIKPDEDTPGYRRNFIVSGLSAPLDAIHAQGVPRVLSRQKKFPDWRVCRVVVSPCRKDSCRVTCEYEQAPVAP